MKKLHLNSKCIYLVVSHYSSICSCRSVLAIWTRYKLTKVGVIPWDMTLFYIVCLSMINPRVLSCQRLYYTKKYKTCVLAGKRMRGVYKKTPWSVTEKTAVIKHLGKYMLSRKVPGKAAIDSCLEKEQCLSSRTWKNVKDFCRNRSLQRDPLLVWFPLNVHINLICGR